MSSELSHDSGYQRLLYLNYQKGQKPSELLSIWHHTVSNCGEFATIRYPSNSRVLETTEDITHE